MISYLHKAFISESRRSAVASLLLLTSLVLNAAWLTGCASGTQEATAPTGTGTQANAQTLSVTLVDANGNQTTSLTAGVPLTVRMRLANSTGGGIAGALITVNTGDSSLATVSPEKVLTDATGVATATLNAASTSSSGAGSVTASADNVVAGTANFQVNAATVALALSSSASSISAYGTTSVTANVTVNGAPPSVPVTVQFNSICLANNKATLATSAQTINGVATISYTDKGCGQTDTVTATVGATQRSVNIAVAPPQAVSIQFDGITPTSLLVLKGTGGVGYTDTAVVSFKVVDSYGAGISNQPVVLGLTTSAGGITLDGSTGDVTKQTDASGVVRASVTAGSLPTSVWVTASSGSLFTQSNKLVISAGKPSQKFFSLSASVLNVEGWNQDGSQTNLTARVADRLGSAVPDGTTVNFVSEGGQIKGSAGTLATCATKDGACTVTFESANFRPSNGRVTILAYALGEESFRDDNGNNTYDAGEPYDDLGNTCIDANENATCDTGEQQIRFSQTNTAACPNASAFNGAPLLPVANTCDAQWGSAFIRQDIVVTFSGQNAIASPTALSTAACSASFPVVLRDVNNNPLPAGTSLSISDVTVADSSASPKAATISVSPTTVPNTNASGGTVHVLTVSATDCTTPLRGTFNLNTRTPLGFVTLIPMTVN